MSMLRITFLLYIRYYYYWYLCLLRYNFIFILGSLLET